ncbi:MAG: hypothetical protein ACLFPV_06685 [Spirochaetaceae bacterium]
MKLLAYVLIGLLLVGPVYSQGAEPDIAGFLEEIEKKLDRQGITPEERADLEAVSEAAAAQGRTAEAERAALLLFLTAGPGTQAPEELPELDASTDRSDGLLPALGATGLSLALFNAALFFGDEVGMAPSTADTIAYTGLGLSLAGLGVVTALVFRGQGDDGSPVFSTPVAGDLPRDRLHLYQVRRRLTRDLLHADETTRGLRIVSVGAYGVSAAAFAGLVASLVLGNEAWNRYNDAAFSADAAELRGDVDRYTRASVTFGSVAVLSAGVGTLALLARPNRDRILRDIEEVDRLIGEVPSGYSSR